MPKAWFTCSGSFTLTTFLQALSGLLLAKFFVDHGLCEVTSSILKNVSRLLSASLVSKNGRFGCASCLHSLPG